MRGVAVIGNLTRDVVDGGPPRVGGAPYHAARALRLLGGRASVVARCSEADRRTLLPQLIALGVPVTWVRARSTAAFTLRYEGEDRELVLEAAGRAVVAGRGGSGRAGRVGARRAAHARRLPGRRPRDSRSRPPARARRPRPRSPRGSPGRCELDGDFDEAVLRHVTVLKLSEPEAEVLGGEERVAALGVPEVLLTQGSRGALLLCGGRRERIPVRPIGGGRPDGRRRRLPRRLRLGARVRAQARVGSPPRRFDRGADARADPT